MQTPLVNTPARTATVAVEDGIRRDSLETGVLIGPDGTILVRRTGNPDHVHLTVGECRRAAGATFTHNHPAGSGPSLEDVRVAALYGMREMRVVTAAFRHGVGMLDYRQLAQLTQDFDQEWAGAMVAVRDDIKRALVNPYDFGSEIRHRTWERLSVRLGFDYWRQRS